MPSRRTLLLVPVLTLVACAAPPRLAAQPAPTPAPLAALVEGYHADGEDLRRFYSVGGSPTRLERLARHGREWAERLAALPEPDLGVAGRVDRLLVLADIAHDGAIRERITARWQRAGELLAWADLIIELEEGRWTLTPFDPADTARRLDGLAATVEALTGRVTRATDDGDDETSTAAEDDAATADDSTDAGDDEGPLPLSAVDGLWLAGEVTRLSGTLRTWHEQSRDFDPGHDWWLAAPYERAREALGALARTLREDVAGQHGRPDDPLVGDPIGADGLAADLAHELLPYSAAQLITLGRRELAWCTDRMEAAAAELGFDDWHEALEHVKGQHVEPGRQDDLVRAQANEAIAFLEERDLVTIPPLCRELWRLRMIGEETQRVLPFAAYSGQHMLVAFPTAGMDHDAKRQAMRGNNIHFSRIVTPHELIPGHHLQGFQADRFATHRRPFSTPFYGEGWALYWEMLLWDQGWARSPENRIGMLFWRMHRAARIIVSLEFHLGRMEPAAMVDFLVERVGHERDNATAEVRRYIGGGYSPLYQCGYMIGGLQLRALARELVDDHGWTLKRFHDAVLRCGPIPIELVRALLLGIELPADHSAAWRWEGEVEPAGE